MEAPNFGAVACRNFPSTLLIGGPYTSMIGKLIQLQFGFHGDAAMGSAMAFTVIGICLVVIFVVGTLVFTVLRVR